MSWLGKLAKKAWRGARKLAKPALRAGAAALTSGASEVAVRAVKGIGAFRPHGARVPKIQPLSVRAVIAKTELHAPGRLKGMPAATTMPGGAPLTGGRRARRRSGPRPTKASRQLQALNRKGRKGGGRRISGGGKRSAPAGGKDFKALSASWKAAGKPGTWLDWVKSH